MLLILLFDLNGFCDISLQHMTYKEKRSHFMMILIIAFLVIDFLIYHMISHSIPLPDVEYAVNRAEHMENSQENNAENSVENTAEHIESTAVADTSDYSYDYIAYCEKEVDFEVEEYQKKIQKTKALCSIPSTNEYIRLSEKLVGNFIAIVLIMIIVMSLTTVQKEGIQTTNHINSTSTKLILSIPIALTAALFVVYTNVYI